MRRRGRPSGPPPPTATRGLAASRSIHSSPSGQGSPWRSIGRSSSMLTVSRMVANSVHTCPSRGPRTARAAASNTASSPSRAEAPEAQGDMDVGRDEHAGVVEIPQQSRRVQGALGVEAIEVDEPVRRGHGALERRRSARRVGGFMGCGRRRAGRSGPQPARAVGTRRRPRTVVRRLGAWPRRLIPRTKRYKTPARFRPGS